VRILSAGYLTISFAVALSGQAPPAAAQVTDTTLATADRAMVTRAQIQAALVQLEGVENAKGYSAALRGRKRAEADLLRERLAEGDLRTGDQIKVNVFGQASLSQTYDITPARTIVLPAGSEISMRGVLRSELPAFLTEKFKAYVRQPVVTAVAKVRLSVFGAVGKPGFQTTPADALLSQAISDAGGPMNNADFKHSKIKRNGRVVIDGAEFQDAIYRARTLDQLNVQAGDEIVVAAKPASGFILRALGVLTGIGGLIYLVRVL
jgi:polysaccharide export outer membrane protein